MSDLSKPPILFTPEEDNDKSNGVALELQQLTFYRLTATTAAAAAAAEESGGSLGEVESPLELPITPLAKKFKIRPADSERDTTLVSPYRGPPVLLYVKRADEEIFHPLHLVPPSLSGLAKALENKYNILPDQIRHFYKLCKKGITVIMDDDLVRLYCNEDTFILDVIKTEDNKYDVTLVEL